MNKNNDDSNFDGNIKIIRIVIVFILLAGIWITTTDSLITFLSDDQNTLRSIQTLKAWVFILITAFYIFYYLNKKNSSSKNTNTENDFLLNTKNKILFENSVEIYFIAEFHSGNIIDANKRFYEVFKFKKNQTINIKNFWPEDVNYAKIQERLNNEYRIDDLSVRFKTGTGEDLILVFGFYLDNSNDNKIILGISNDITKENASKRELYESELKYRTLIENMQDGVFLIQDYKVIYTNYAFANLLGHSIDELTDHNFLEFIYPDQVPIIQDRYEKRLKREPVPHEYQTFMKTKDGRRLAVNISVGTIYYKGKTANLGTAKNLSDKVEIEEALIQTETKYKEILDLLPQTVFEVDINGAFKFANKTGFLMFGYPVDTDINELNIFHMITPESIPIARANFIYNIENKTSASSEYTGLRKDGSTFPIIVFSTCIIRDGIVIGIRGILVDITDRKKAEEKVYQLSQALEQSKFSVIISDLNGFIQYVNPAFTEMTGYSLQEAYGKRPSLVKSDYHPQEFYSQLWQTITSGKEWKGELYNRRKDGTLYWELASISPIRDKRGKTVSFLAIKEDITQKKIIEFELIKAKEKAEESDRLKTNFLAQVSHEIRTPLNIIMGYNNYLKTELKSTVDESFLPIFDSIYSAGRRLFRTIDLILNMANVQAGKIEPLIKEIDLISLLKIIVKDFKNYAANKKINLVLETSNEPIIINSDEYLVNQIFQNLVDNAIKYTNQGTVTIKLFLSEDNKPLAEIIDTGIGISESYMEKLFVPFSQEESGYERRFDGNGLGLALVKNYLEAIGAEIKVESKLGEGSKFTIKF